MAKPANMPYSEWRLDQLNWRNALKKAFSNQDLSEIKELIDEGVVLEYEFELLDSDTFDKVQLFLKNGFD